MQIHVALGCNGRNQAMLSCVFSKDNHDNKHSFIHNEGNVDEGIANEWKI